MPIRSSPAPRVTVRAQKRHAAHGVAATIKASWSATAARHGLCGPASRKNCAHPAWYGATDGFKDVDVVLSPRRQNLGVVGRRRGNAWSRSEYTFEARPRQRRRTGAADRRSTRELMTRWNIDASTCCSRSVALVITNGGDQTTSGPETHIWFYFRETDTEHPACGTSEKMPSAALMTNTNGRRESRRGHPRT